MKPKDLIKLCDDFKIKGITANSKEVKPNFIFAATRGYKEDGNKFIREAIKKGARVIVSEKHAPKWIAKEIAWIKVKDARKSISRLASEFYKGPSKKIKVIGVTGTNGKTSVSYLIEQLLKESSRPALVIGTIDYHFQNKIIPATNTTPGAIRLQGLLAEAEKKGIADAVMEVSSHALDQQRVADVDFAYAIFTNLTQDHLDYHLRMDKYFQAKAKLFRFLKRNAVAIINADDRYAKALIKLTKAKVFTYALEREADFKAFDLHSDINGLKFGIIFGKKKMEIHSQLIGRHNLYNILAAASFALADGIKPDKIKAAIAKFRAPSGRLEEVRVPASCRVFVDYAHTPDALKNVILALREVSTDKILLVFGCGGGRDKKKRPLMGRIATELADFTLVTSDNPRNEDPQAIIKDIRKGIKRDNFKVVVNRKEAIYSSLKMAGQGDIVLIAGKGHEQQQVIKKRVIAFDDRKIVKGFFK